MKRLINILMACALLLFSFNACTNEESVAADDSTQISTEVLAQIKALGFSTDNVIKEADGYIVEGDIFLPIADLERSDLHQHNLRVAQAEQYRTTNLVTGLPRVIKVSIATTLPSSYVEALDEAIARYNAEGLSVTFQRVSSGANISITKAPFFATYLASAGFPTSSGAPFNSIKVSTRSIGNQPQSTVASILAHEIGHCIGFRHTDYADRSYSCGGATSNEGDGGVGAILIPGTPSGPDPNSWMLACIGSGQNRPFNANDKTALGFLY